MSSIEQWTRKYRPNTFASYVGNERTKQEILQLLKLNKLPQTLLFSGPQGTGKTTLARLLAKNLMCETPNVDGTACGTCYNCEQLDDEYIGGGKTTIGIPVRDVNLADVKGIDEVRELTKEMGTRSAYGSKRVFILDEIQEASQAAQSTFLKIAEEPGDGLYIIMCTTHPDKLAKAFKSRFHQYAITKPTVTDLSDRIAHICQNEGVNYSKEGLRLLVSKLSRIPRECINKAEVLGATGTIDRTNVEQSLGMINYEEFIRFINRCFNGSITDLATMYDDLDTKGIALKSFVSDFGAFLVDVTRAQANMKLEAYTPAELKELRKASKGLTSEMISQIFSVLRKYKESVDLQEFEFYALGLEIHQILNPKEQVFEPDRTQLEKSYKSVTQKMAEAKEVAVNEATEDDIMNIFNGAQRIKSNTEG